MNRHEFGMDELEERTQADTCQALTVCVPVVLVPFVFWLCTTVTVCTKP
jgi:hypothetical protein